MDKKKQRLLIGIGFAILGYFVFKKYGAKLFAPKLASTPTSEDNQANFLNDDGNGSFVAKQYDPIKKATWISYQNSDVVGYWLSGKIEQGTPIHGLT
jgi:hypothetical protein